MPTGVHPALMPHACVVEPVPLPRRCREKSPERTPPRGGRMKYRTLDWNRIEDGDVSLDDERQSGL
jgi:hypothetical protein